MAGNWMAWCLVRYIETSRSGNVVINEYMDERLLDIIDRLEDVQMTVRVFNFLWMAFWLGRHEEYDDD